MLFYNKSIISYKNPNCGFVEPSEIIRFIVKKHEVQPSVENMEIEESASFGMSVSRMDAPV